MNSEGGRVYSSSGDSAQIIQSLISGSPGVVNMRGSDRDGLYHFTLGRIEVRPNAKEITDAQMKDESGESTKNLGKWIFEGISVGLLNDFITFFLTSINAPFSLMNKHHEIQANAHTKNY